MNSTNAVLKFWHHFAPQLLAVRGDAVALAALLQPEHDRLIYRIRLTQPDSGFRAGESWFLAPCLCTEEAHALCAVLLYPSRSFGDFRKLARPQIETSSKSLGELLESAADLGDGQAKTPSAVWVCCAAYLMRKPANAILSMPVFGAGKW